MDYLGKKPEIATHTYSIKDSDIAAFNGETVHPVFSTYALAREAEWAGRLVLLPLLNENEEGIGTQISLTHLGPAFPGEEILFEAIPLSLENGELMVSIKATVNGRPVAQGTTGQKILPKKVIAAIFNKAQSKT
jgi:fluoroacetyl-CoA thioesterase